jgi:hypothetical protein
MIIEMFVFLAFVVAVGAIIVKAFEWRQHVLYDPYNHPSFSRRIRRTADIVEADAPQN